MDYSKRGIEKKQKQVRASVSKAEKKLNFTLFRVMIIGILLIAVAGISAGVGGFKGIIDSAPVISPDDIAPDAFKSYIYDVNGDQILELVESGANRIEVDISQMSVDLQNAFIALEDERFWEHNGIDPKGIVRAFIIGLPSFNFSQGASTITQQVIKNSIFSGGNETNQLLRFKRKFQEQSLALELEEKVPKEKILQAYLNSINLGESCYGVEAASQMYFDKHASQINASEAAVLASIAQSPTKYNPYRNPVDNEERRQMCLEKMLNQGLINQEEYDLAIQDDVYTRIANNTVNYKSENYKTTTYYQDSVIDKLISEFVEYYGYQDDPSTPYTNEARVQAQHKLYSGGYSIYLAQDPQLQAIVDTIFTDDSNFPSKEYLLQWALTVYDENDQPTNYSTEMLETRLKQYYGEKGYSYTLLYRSEEKADADIALYKELEGIPSDANVFERKSLVPQVQASFVLMDQHTGYVKALVGGRGTKTESRTFNRATQAKRQPGSSFKIVSTYAPAIDAKGESLASTELDKIYEGYGGHKFRNVTNRYTNRQMTYKDAIIRSTNTVAVRVMDNIVTPEFAFNFLQERFHFTTLVEGDKVTSMALGGLNGGVTNFEMTAAYASIANDGIYTEPVLYTKVVDHDGNVIIDHTVSETSVAVSPATAAMLTDAMLGVVENYAGTARMVKMGDMDVAGKTGTTTDYRDLWFVGYTPYYTAGIWFGYDDNTSMRGKVRSTYDEHKYLWKKLMTAIHDGLEPRQFELPDSVEKVFVCTETGKLARSSCKGEYLLCDIGSAPDEWCSGHRKTETETQAPSDDTTTENGTGTTTPVVPIPEVTIPEVSTTPNGN